MLLGDRPQAQQPSFLWVLLTTFSSNLLISACFKLIQDLLSFVNPQLLRSRLLASLALPLWLGPGVQNNRQEKVPQPVSASRVAFSEWHCLCTAASPQAFHLYLGVHTEEWAWVPSKASLRR